MKRLLRWPPVQWFLALLIWAYFELVIATMRWRVANIDGAVAVLESPSGLLALFWHGRLTQAIACRPQLRGKQRRVIISRSRDGAFIALAAERLGIPPIRGSTGRPGQGLAKGGAGAFRQAVKFITDGGVGLITPDGPRGPAAVMPAGPVQLARAAACPVVLMGLAARPAIALGSWDGARIPLPFARGRLVIDGPLRVAPGALEPTRADWQARLNAAQARAEALLAGDRADGSRPVSLGIYQSAARAAALIAPAVLRARARRGKEQIDRLGERLGRAGGPRPPGTLVWFHGASVGESLSLLPLIDRLATLHPNAAVLVTSGTRASAEIMGRRLPTFAIHQYAPIDTPGAVARFLDHWRPDLGVFAESELWPNLILGAKARGVKMALTSARLSEASLKGWRKAPGLARAVLGAFDLLLARDEAAAARIRGLGARVDGLADGKFGASPLPADEPALSRLNADLAGRPVILAASTHQGEEALVIQGFAVARGDADRAALLVIVPRHPERGPAIHAMAQAGGLQVGLATTTPLPGDNDVFVADTLGDLGVWYRLASVALIGGSLVTGVGGHNPLEAARVDCPLIFGAHVDSWPIYEALERQGAARRIAGPAELETAFGDALRATPDLAAMAARARAFVDGKDAEARAATRRVFALLVP